MFGLGKPKHNWTHKTDVLVIGSGGAGLTAAISAKEHGADVLVIEKSDKVGGTTAVSGGVVWVPNNHHMSEVGVADSREDALKYLTRIADGRTEPELIERYVDTAPEMALFLEEKTPLKFTALGRYPDYHPEFDGGKAGEDV